MSEGTKWLSPLDSSKVTAKTAYRTHTVDTNVREQSVFALFPLFATLPTLRLLLRLRTLCPPLTNDFHTIVFPTRGLSIVVILLGTGLADLEIQQVIACFDELAL